MKPLGTITMCFPHVDEDTRSILEVTMDEAENFADFTERLCERVLSEPTSPLLEYLAFYFSFSIWNFKLTDRLEQARKIPSMAEPLLFVTWVSRQQEPSWEVMSTSILQAINVAPNDWFATQLYLTWRLQVVKRYTETDVDVRPIEIIASNVCSNKDLEFFRSYLKILEADACRLEKRTGEEIALLKEALLMARKYDDQVLATSIQCRIANRLKHTNLRAAIDLLQSTKETSEQLGYRSALMNTIFELGHIMAIRGEINAGIEYQLEYLSLREEVKSSYDHVKIIIAFYYNQIGDGERALEYASSGYDSTYIRHRRLSFPLIQTSWALINLDRRDEAKRELATAHEIVLQSAHNLMLIFYRMVEGILDKIENNFDAAIACFEEILKSIEVDPTLPIQNICLLNLTEIEIELLDEEALEEKSEMSGPWMQRLFKHSETKNLPGITARTKILQARLRQKQKRFEETRRLLKDVQNMADHFPSMKYLKELINTTFPDLITRKARRSE